jgi:hypothetical protein
MKKLLLLLLSTHLFINASAQAPTMEVGEGVSTMTHIPQALLGEQNGQYILLTWKMSLSLSSMIANAATSIEDLKLAYFDSKTLNLSKAVSLPEFKGEGVTRTGNVRLEELVLHGDTLDMFTSTWDKEAKNYAIHAWQLDASTGKPFKGEAKLIAKIEDGKKSDTRRTSIYHYEKTGKTVLSYFNTSRKEETTKIDILVLDNTLEEVRKSELVISDTKRGDGIKNITADKAGNIYIIFNVWEDDGEEDVLINRLAFVPINGNAPTTVDIKTEGGDITSSTVHITESNKVFLLGYYSRKEGPEGKDDIAAGSFIAEIDVKDGDVFKVAESELTQNQKVSLVTESMNPNMARNRRLREMRYMKVSEIFEDPAGNITMVGSVRYEYTVSSNGRSTTTYCYNSGLVTKFKQDCSVAWQTMIPRKAFINSANFGMFPSVTFSQGKTYILFTDHEDNIEPLGLIASGKKSASKSKSKGPVKPKDYPPTDSDQPTELDDWNMKRTALRLTTIDELGNWKINWMQPVGDDEDKKIPALEGQVFKQLNDKEFVAAVFTKYGMMGFKQFGLARIKY